MFIVKLFPTLFSLFCLLLMSCSIWSVWQYLYLRSPLQQDPNLASGTSKRASVVSAELLSISTFTSGSLSFYLYHARGCNTHLLCHFNQRLKLSFNWNIKVSQLTVQNISHSVKTFHRFQNLWTWSLHWNLPWPSRITMQWDSAILKSDLWGLISRIHPLPLKHVTMFLLGEDIQEKPQRIKCVEMWNGLWLPVFWMNVIQSSSGELCSLIFLSLCHAFALILRLPYGCWSKPLSAPPYIMTFKFGLLGTLSWLCTAKIHFLWGKLKDELYYVDTYRINVSCLNKLQLVGEPGHTQSRWTLLELVLIKKERKILQKP